MKRDEKIREKLERAFLEGARTLLCDLNVRSVPPSCSSKMEERTRSSHDTSGTTKAHSLYTAVDFVAVKHCESVCV